MEFFCFFHDTLFERVRNVWKWFEFRASLIFILAVRHFCFVFDVTQLFRNTKLFYWKVHCWDRAGLTRNEPDMLLRGSLSNVAYSIDHLLVTNGSKLHCQWRFLMIYATFTRLKNRYSLPPKKWVRQPSWFTESSSWNWIR